MSDSETKFLTNSGEDITNLLHPSGKCSCAGEGTCDWCKNHCMECGSTKEAHPITEEIIEQIRETLNIPLEGAEPHNFVSKAGQSMMLGPLAGIHDV